MIWSNTSIKRNIIRFLVIESIFFCCYFALALFYPNFVPEFASKITDLSTFFLFANVALSPLVAFRLVYRIQHVEKEKAKIMAIILSACVIIATAFNGFFMAIMVSGYGSMPILNKTTKGNATYYIMQVEGMTGGGATFFRLYASRNNITMDEIGTKLYYSHDLPLDIPDDYTTEFVTPHGTMYFQPKNNRKVWFDEST